MVLQPLTSQLCPVTISWLSAQPINVVEHVVEHVMEHDDTGCSKLLC